MWASGPSRTGHPMVEQRRVFSDSALAKPNELSSVEQEAALQMRRAQRTMWLTSLVGLATASVLIIWAVLGPNLSDRSQITFGLLVAIEATAMGFALAIYARRTHVSAVWHYLRRLRELAQKLQEASGG